MPKKDTPHEIQFDKEKILNSTLLNEELLETKSKISRIIHRYVTGDDEKLKNLESDLILLRPVDRVTAMLKLMSYVIPTLGSVKTGDAAEDNEINVNVRHIRTLIKKDDDVNLIDYSDPDFRE